MSAAPRYTLVDVLRLLANLSVVSHHVRGESIFGVAFGMPLFLTLMFAFASSSTRRESVAHFARRRARFFLEPWLRWSVVFLIVLALRDLHRGRSPWDRFTIHTLFYGGHVHYWFLPFAAGVIGVARLLQSLARRHDPRLTTLVLGGMGAITTLAMHALLVRYPLPHPYPGWGGSLPALWYGAAVGQSLRLGDMRRRRALLAYLPALALAACLFDPAGQAGIQWRYAVAVPLVCLAFAWRPHLPRAVQALATTSFGIYLLHPIPILGVRQVVDPSGWSALVHVLVVWGASVLLVVALRRVRPGWRELGRPPSAPRRAAGELGTPGGS